MEIRLESSTPERSALGDEVSKAIRKVLGLRVTATLVDHGALPRFELKAHRFTDRRKDERG